MDSNIEKNQTRLENKLELGSFSIETERLLLRPVSMEYAEEIYKEFDDEITEYMSPSTPEDIADTKKFIEESTKGFLKGEEIVAVILKKNTLEYLGNGGIHHIDTKTPELGIWIKKGAHGNHYGREAIAGLKKWADMNLDYKYLKYPVAEENVSSRKIAESLGGKEVLKYPHANQKGVPLNIVEYHIFSGK